MSSSSLDAGVTTLIVAFLVSCVGLTLVTDSCFHLFLIAPSIFLSLWAIKKIG